MGDETENGEEAVKKKEMSQEEFDDLVEGKVENVIHSFVKTPTDEFTEMVKSEARNALSGDHDERAYDDTMRKKNELMNGAEGIAGPRASSPGRKFSGGGGQAASKFGGMRVLKGHNHPAFQKRGQCNQNAPIGSGEIAARATLYCLKALEKYGARFEDQDVRKIAKERGDKQVADLYEKNMQSDIGSEGGRLIPEAVGDLIGMLQGMTVLRQLDPVFLAFNDSNDIVLPRGNSGVSASWSGEGGSVNASNPTIDEVRLTANKLMALVIQTNEFIRYSPQGAEQMIRDDLQKAVGETEEQAFLRSPGTNNEPTGLKYLMDSSNRDIDRTQSGSTSTIQEIVQDHFKLREQVHGKGNDVPMMRPAYVHQHRTFLGIQSITDANDQLNLMSQMLADGELFGVPVGVTTQLPEDLDPDSNDSTDQNTELYYCEMSEFIIADGLDARIDEADQATVTDSNGNDVKLFNTDQRAVRITTETDTALKHPKAAAQLKNVDYGADYVGT